MAMGKIMLMMSVSLDGFIEGSNRELDWHLVGDELRSHFQHRAQGDGRPSERTCHLRADGQILTDGRHRPVE
jgi:dihydrofolate reductase